MKKKYRLFIKGQCVSESQTKRMAELALKVNGYKGTDWIIWLGTRFRPMTQVIATGSL